MSRDRVRDWDAHYASDHFAAQWHYDYPSPELVGFLAGIPLPAGSTVLDVGCGAGSDAIYLAQLGFRVIGVDVSARALAVASARSRAHGVAPTWLVADVLELPMPPNQVALVTDRGCFHHIPPASRPRYAAEIQRVLAPGGRLFLRGFAGRDEILHTIDEQVIDACFVARGFARGPVLPIHVPTNGGGFQGVAVVLRKR